MKIIRFFRSVKIRFCWMKKIGCFCDKNLIFFHEFFHTKNQIFFNGKNLICSLEKSAFFG